MKKIVKVEDIDCANCAAELERGIAKIDGVKSVSISFMIERMEIEIDDERYTEVVKQIKKVKNRIEQDCEIIGL